MASAQGLAALAVYHRLMPNEMDELLDFLAFIGTDRRGDDDPKFEGCSVEEAAEYLVPLLKPKKECPVPVKTEAGIALQGFYPLGKDSPLEQELPLNFVRQLRDRGPFSFDTLPEFEGDGVYALYWQGDDPRYENIKSTASTIPIYVGKSSRPGRSTGESDDDPEQCLYDRLTKEHLESIKQVANKDPKMGPENFTIRFLILQGIWVDAAEESLIRLHRPVWNCAVRGFGARSYSKDQRSVTASAWDTLHPGREGAGKKPRSLEEVVEGLEKGIIKCRQADEDLEQALGVSPDPTRSS